MSKIFRTPQLKVKKTLDVAMYITMALGLIVISVFASVVVTNCATVQIISKYKVFNKYFYQLSDGSQTWSNQEFTVNDRVCLPNSISELAQK
jgi:hypothetical protein